MNSATRSTLMLLALAATSAVVAMIFYPWPETIQTDAEIGQPLFDEYGVDQIRGIDIIKFDKDQSTLDRLKLKRRGDKWVIPAKDNFIATESQLIGVVVNSLNKKTIYDVISENQEDHIKYGVVDPVEYTSEQNIAALGQKLTLTDRNSKSIASIIVGAPLKNNATQRYVRIPGKPRVYTIDFDPQILRTEFPFWVSRNALQLRTQTNPDGPQLTSIRIDNYRINQADDQESTKAPLYRAIIRPTKDSLRLESLLLPRKEQPGKWIETTATPRQRVSLLSGVEYLGVLVINDVRPKSKTLSKALKQPAPNTPDSAFAELANYGFYKTGLRQGRWLFDSDNGQVSVTTTQGVLITISIGKVAGADADAKGKVNRFAMINAAVDYNELKKPVRPEGVEDDESEENRAYRQQLDQWEKAVKVAQRAADDLNAIHGNWYYLIGETVIDNLRPDINPPLDSTSDNAATDSSTTPRQPAKTPPQKSSPPQKSTPSK